MTVHWRTPGPAPKLTRAQVEQLQSWAAFATDVPKAARRLGICPTTARKYIKGEHKWLRRA